MSLDGTGLTVPTQEEITADINGDLLANVHAQLDLDPDQPMGEIVQVFANALSKAWETLRAAFDAMDDESVEDASQDNLCALTGTRRILDTRGSVTVNCALTLNTVLPSTAQVALDTDATNVWQLVTPFRAPSTGTFPLTFRAINVGAITALSGHLTAIATPVAGWSTATNPLDATPGTLRESNNALRLRRRKELAADGDSTAPSLQAQAQRITGVISATVLENETETTDANGVPGHATRLVIWDGVSPAALNQSVFDCVGRNKGGGMQSDGVILGTWKDSDGNSHDVAFSRAGQVPITIVLTVLTNGDFPLGGGAALAAALLAEGQTNRKVGQAASVERSRAVCFDRDDTGAFRIPGIVSITLCTINGGTTDIAVSALSIATYDSSRITVNVT